MKKNRFSILILILIIVLAVSAVGGAKGADAAAKAAAEKVSNGQILSFVEAIRLGRNNNYQLEQLREKVAGIKREMDLIRASLDWQVNLKGGYNWLDSETGPAPSLPGSDRQKEGGSVSLEFNKTFLFGLNVSPQVKIDTEDEEPEYSIKVSQKLYPLLPTDAERKYYQLEKELVRAEEELAQTWEDLLISWLEQYLELVRLKEKKELQEERLKLARANLEEMLARAKIGEAGQQAILTAQIELKQAEYGLRVAENEFNQQKTALYNELNIRQDRILLLDDGAEFIGMLQDLVAKRIPGGAEKRTGEEDSADEDSADKEKLWAEVEDDNYKLKALRLDREYLVRELKWLQKEGQLDISFSGSYDSATYETVVGIDLSYNLYDGGSRKLELETQEEEIRSREREYLSLCRELQLQLDKLFNAIELSRLNVEQQELAAEKASLEAELAEKRFQQGVIDRNEYRQFLLQQREARINLKSARDGLLISKLRLMSFAGSELIELVKQIDTVD